MTTQPELTAEQSAKAEQMAQGALSAFNFYPGHLTEQEREGAVLEGAAILLGHLAMRYPSLIDFLKGAIAQREADA